MGNYTPEYGREYRAKTREHRLAYLKQYHQTPNGRYSRYKTDAKRQNWSFEITFDDFNLLTSLVCYYCKEFSNAESQFTGLDRIDSNQGYTLENVTPCCEQCNRMKVDYTVTEFLSKVLQIANNLEIRK